MAHILTCTELEQKNSTHDARGRRALQLAMSNVKHEMSVSYSSASHGLGSMMDLPKNKIELIAPLRMTSPTVERA